MSLCLLWLALIHLSLIPLMHTYTHSSINDLLMKINWSNCAGSVIDISLNHLNWAFVQLSIMTNLIKHDLTFWIATSFVIQLIIFHPHLSIHVALLEVGTQWSLSLVLCSVHPNYLLVLHLLLMLICTHLHNDCLLSSLSCILSWLTKATLFLIHSKINLWILIYILILHSFLVGHTLFHTSARTGIRFLTTRYLHLIIHLILV